MTTPSTARLRLVPSTAALVRAEIADHAALGAALEADIPANWPPDTLTDALPFFLEQIEAAPDTSGWWGWYALLHDPAADVLAASGGFMGPPNNGVVEIGYSVLPQFQRRGLATEMMQALVAWAAQHPGVTQIVAEVDAENEPSRRVLVALGFVEAGAGREPGHLHFALPVHSAMPV